LFVATAASVWRIIADYRAHSRAEVLLRTHLSDAELAQLNRCGYLEVPSPQYTGRVYQVDALDTRVSVLQDGEMVQRLCIRTSEPLPAREAVLAHKLMIETLEDDYMQRANVVWFRPAAKPECG